MNEAFKQLDEEKKQRILRAAYQEFSEMGYKSASTNVIAKQAGIGKGTLFNYFGTKEKLFHDLVGKAFSVIKEEYIDKIDYDDTDFFERLRKASVLKWKIFIKYRAEMSFMTQIFVHSDEFVLPKELQKKRAYAEKFWGNILTKNIDFSKFREDIPAEMSFNFVRWTLEGYRAELEAKFKMDQSVSELTDEMMKPYYDEFYSYLDTLKKIYYRPEFVEKEK